MIVVKIPKPVLINILPKQLYLKYSNIYENLSPNNILVDRDGNQILREYSTTQ